MEEESMSEWKEVRLGDIVTVKSGYAYKGKYISNKGKNILLGMGCVSYNDKFLYSGARAYDEDCDERYCAKAGDIVLATRQQSDSLPILAMPAIIPDSLFDKKIIVGTNLYLIKNDSDIDNHFLFWLLKTPNYVNYISSVKTGTTVRMVTKKDVENYTFNCPSKEERDTISNILWGIDAKIETNNKLNEKLEEMAQAIFKSWFVDFEPFKDKPFHETELGMIPEGWEVKNIDHLYDIKYGNNLSTSEIKKSGQYPVYGANGVIGYYDVSNCNDYSVLITSRGNGSGDVYRTHSSKSYVTNNSFIVKPKSNYSWIELSYIYYSFLNINFKSYTNGSAQPQLTNKSIHNIDILLPTKKEIQNFCNLTMPIVYNIELLMRENDRLASLRDTLLPRLMSGELIV